MLPTGIAKEIIMKKLLTALTLTAALGFAASSALALGETPVDPYIGPSLPISTVVGS